MNNSLLIKQLSSLQYKVESLLESEILDRRTPSEFISSFRGLLGKIVNGTTFKERFKSFETLKENVQFLRFLKDFDGNETTRINAKDLMDEFKKISSAFKSENFQEIADEIIQRSENDFKRIQMYFLKACDAVQKRISPIYLAMIGILTILISLYYYNFSETYNKIGAFFKNIFTKLANGFFMDAIKTILNACVDIISMVAKEIWDNKYALLGVATGFSIVFFSILVKAGKVIIQEDMF